MALHGVNGFGNRLGRGEEAKPPTGHAPRLREAVNDDRVVLVRRAEAGDALHHGTVVGEVLVDFVAHDEDALFHADVADGLDFVRGIDAAGGIAGRIQDEQSRLGRDGGKKLGGRDFELGLVRGGQDHRRGAGELDHLRVTQPVGGRDDDLVAFLAGGDDDVEAGVLAAAGDDDLRRLVVEAVLALELVGDGLAQLGDAAAGRVFGEAGGERGSGGVLDVLGGVEVRFAGAKADDVFAGGLHGFGFGINGQGE